MLNENSAAKPQIPLQGSGGTKICGWPTLLLGGRLHLRASRAPRTRGSESYLIVASLRGPEKYGMVHM